MRRAPATAPRPATLHVRLATGEVAAPLRALVETLGRARGGTATIDMADVRRLDPPDLAALAAAASAARTGGVELRCAAVTPPVYKALHLAKLATLVTRAPATPPAEEGDP